MVQHDQISWYKLPISDVYTKLNTSPTGLTHSNYLKRLSRYGPNSLPEGKQKSFLSIFISQFTSPLIYVLLIVCIILLALHELTDSGIIMAVLFFNACVGTIQEGKAQNTLRALKRLSQAQATVLRDGKQIIVPDSEIVPGDIVVLSEGQKIPADGRIIEEFNLTVNEATLTGEVIPIHKLTLLPAAAQKKSSLPLGDQVNMVFMGTFVSSGRAQIVVTATGQSTELGKIAQSIMGVDTDIPLRRNVEKLIYQIIWVVSIIGISLFIFGVSQGYPLLEMFKIVISLAVSAIPEGLPVVLTLVLASGVWRMSKRQALVKKLEAVEALGQTTIIAVDKTGTITQNQLMVTDFILGDDEYTVTGNGYEPTGELSLNSVKVNIKKLSETVTAALRIAALNNSSQVAQDEETQTWRVTGDPTEGALQVLASKFGVEREVLLEKVQIIEDYPFEYERRFRAVVFKKGKQSTLAITGAPETVIAACGLGTKEHERLIERVAYLSSQGLRVVAFATVSNPKDTSLSHLPVCEFGGFFGMKDNLHPEVHRAVESVRTAGIRVVMITGDHKETARAIAQEAAIYRQGDDVITGEELEELSEKELLKRLDTVSVFARVTPEHKQQIIELFRKKGHVVAMTGDGVNDAPPLVSADLGIAMGKSGTEVAKEAADIVLLDDNFNSIVAAIEEGRSIYKTIQKVIAYLFATSLGEIMVLTGALLLHLPLPVTAAQLIWLNLVTDGFLDVSLAMEPREEGLLKEKWQASSRSLIDGVLLQRMVLFALVMMVGTLWLFIQYKDASPTHTSAIILTLMAAYQWFNAWNSRHVFRSTFAQSPLTNPFLIAATAVVFGLQMAALYVPFLQRIFNTQPLTIQEWLMVIGLASTALFAEELRKAIVRAFKSHRVAKQRRSIALSS